MHARGRGEGRLLAGVATGTVRSADGSSLLVTVYLRARETAFTECGRFNENCRRTNGASDFPAFPGGAQPVEAASGSIEVEARGNRGGVGNGRDRHATSERYGFRGG